MFFLIIEFFAKWLDEGRFPREELRMRLSIALAGTLVLITLGILLVVNALN